MAVLSREAAPESKEHPICLQHKYRLKFNLITRRTGDCYAKLITPTCLSAVCEMPVFEVCARAARAKAQVHREAFFKSHPPDGFQYLQACP